MFSGLRSASPSPCPSPVRDLVNNLKLVSSPKRDKYKTMIESQEPIISRGRLTMNGGFQDFRPQLYGLEKSDSVDSEVRTPSLSSSSRSASCDSMDAVPNNVVKSRRFVKVPRKALKNVMNQLSPRLTKKLMQEEKKYEDLAPQHPMWPNVMTTYARGVSTDQVEKLVKPVQPSLTAMKANAILEDRRNIRAAIKMIANDINQREKENEDTGSEHSSSSSDHENDVDITLTDYSTANESYEPAEEIANNLMQFHLQNDNGLLDSNVFPMNPQINILPPSPNNRFNPIDGDFHEESIFEALDLDAVPTLLPEDLEQEGVMEVRNVHLFREFIILETAPPSESVFV